MSNDFFLLAGGINSELAHGTSSFPGRWKYENPLQICARVKLLKNRTQEILEEDPILLLGQRWET